MQIHFSNQINTNGRGVNINEEANYPYQQLPLSAKREGEILNDTSGNSYKNKGTKGTQQVFKPARPTNGGTKYTAKTKLKS